MSRTKRRKKTNLTYDNINESMDSSGYQSSKFRTMRQWMHSDCPEIDYTKCLKKNANSVMRQQERKQISEFVKNGIDLSEESVYDPSYEDSKIRSLSNLVEYDG